MKPFEIIREREVYKYKNRFSVIEADMISPIGKEASWEYLKMRDGVIILALDEDNNVYLKREWRLNRKGFVVELPSGWVEGEEEDKEDIYHAANRELQEELGFKANKLEHLLSFYPTNHANNQYHIFLARELVESKLEFDHHEHLEPMKLSFEEAFELIRNSQKPTAQVILAFYEAEKKIEI